MRHKGFIKHLQKRKLNSKDIVSSIKAVEDFENYLKEKKGTLQSATVDGIKQYILKLIQEGKNSAANFAAIARYFYYTKKYEQFIYLVSIFGAADVPRRIGERIGTTAGAEVRIKIFKGIKYPPMGSPQEEYPEVTRVILERMEANLTSGKCREILTWNYHKVPASMFKENKMRFEKYNDIDDYLEEEHKMLVNELQSCMKKGAPWFEQKITPEVLEFVRNNQEINTGLRKGNKIYKTKIPYAPENFLKETDPMMRGYYGCHCPLVRTAIRNGTPKISPLFCYCSAGYEKLHFDVIFGKDVEVELLETLLNGGSRCRFAIKIPKEKVKQQ